MNPKDIRAAFEKAFGKNVDFLSEKGSWFIEGYKSGHASRTEEVDALQDEVAMERQINRDWRVAHARVESKLMDAEARLAEIDKTEPVAYRCKDGRGQYEYFDNYTLLKYYTDKESEPIFARPQAPSQRQEYNRTATGPK